MTPGRRAGVPPGRVRIPDIVRRIAGDRDPQVAWENELGGVTFRTGDRFVKWNPRATGIDLDEERARLTWAIRWHAVPEVLEHGEDEESQWLVTRALPGDGAVTPVWLRRPLEAARAIGLGLRMLHDALPVDDCPFDWSAELRRTRHAPVGLPTPPVDRLVVCHGDACSPNTVIAPDGSPSGHVDLGSLGVADRWADLAVASESLHWNFDPAGEREFWDAYGIEPDEERIRFYRALWHADELPWGYDGARADDLRAHRRS